MKSKIQKNKSWNNQFNLLIKQTIANKTEIKNIIILISL